MIHVRRQAALAGLFGMQADTISAGEVAERWPLMNQADVIGAVGRQMMVALVLLICVRRW